MNLYFNETPVTQSLPRASHSFRGSQDKVPNTNNCWHCHSEIELIHFHKASGTRYVGNTIKRFNAGNILISGTAGQKVGALIQKVLLSEARLIIMA